MANFQQLLPVILAGGGGTRLWPLSRSSYPKQFLTLGGDESLLQQTLRRIPAQVDGHRSLSPLVVCNEEHRFLVAEQARQIGVDLLELMLEPVGRNTAPALTAAADRAQRDGDDPVLIMMPADHLISNADAFSAALQSAVEQATTGALVTFGVVPTRAETGYGYIELGPAIGSQSGVYGLAGFREKPDQATAERYIENGGFLWNAGIFVMRASVWLEHAAHYCPQIAASASAAVATGHGDGDFFRLDSEAFNACPSDSIDYAVMEPLAASGSGAVVVALDAGWSDVGSWQSLWQVSPKDASGNVLRGDVCALDSNNNIVYADHRLVATLGCDNLVIIETADSVMVAAQNRTEDVKSVVTWLSERDRDERLTHRRVYRPWGSYEGVDAGPGFQVKRITVNPGEALSLQSHNHRAEHWIVVSGTARVTLGDDIFDLAANESTYIPIGEKHRLENPGGIALELIEVQSGAYLGEDDIIRFEDRYRRV